MHFQLLQVRWQRSYFNNDGRRLTGKMSVDTSVEDNTKTSIEKPTFSTWRLRLKNTNVFDSGNYTCFVYTTRQNRQEANMTVNVLVPPSLDPERTSSDTVVREGDRVDMVCNASGIPPPTIEWTRLGGALLPIGKEKHLKPLLAITSIRPEDRGRYRCKVYNRIGMEQRDISIDVRFRPIVRARYKILKQAVGYLIELQCMVTANPFPSNEELKWLQGTRSISLSGGRFQIKVVRGAFNRMTYELILNGVKESDYGEYTCQIQNAEGSSSAKIKLEHTDTPQPSVKLNRIISGSSPLFTSFTTFLVCLLAVILNH